LCGIFIKIVEILKLRLKDICKVFHRVFHRKDVKFSTDLAENI
jgi:hypothetical protein